MTARSLYAHALELMQEETTGMINKGKNNLKSTKLSQPQIHLVVSDIGAIVKLWETSHTCILKGCKSQYQLLNNKLVTQNI